MKVHFAVSHGCLAAPGRLPATWNFTGRELEGTEETPSSEEPDVVSGNTSDCYICGRPFAQLAKFVQKCVIKMEHSHRDQQNRLHSYTLSVCIWCHASHIANQSRR